VSVVTHGNTKGLITSRVIIVMGVTGCGKSTVGTALAARLDVPFLDADDYHPEANIAKMSQGIPLKDEDRWPWLDTLSEALKEQATNRGMAVSACSALRRIYRDHLVVVTGEPILFAFLNGSRDTIAKRMAARTDHYMPTALLDSQFQTLEPPESDENAIFLDITPPVSELTEIIYEQLGCDNQVESGV